MQLVEEDRVRLSDHLNHLGIDFPRNDQITVEQLLDHSSGVPDYGQVEGFGQRLLSDRQRHFSVDELLASAAAAKPEFAPGAGYAYSNTDYLLLGKVITAASGHSWSSEVRRQILEPLHLRDTFIAGQERATGAVMPGYFDTDNDGEEENVETGQAWPALETSEDAAGSIVSSAADLAVFGDALFHGRLITPDDLRAMTAEHRFHPRNTNYGYGMEIAHLGYQLTALGHGGYLPGFRSLLWYIPNRDLVLTVLINDSNADPADLAELLLRDPSVASPQGTLPTASCQP